MKTSLTLPAKWRYRIGSLLFHLLLLTAAGLIVWLGNLFPLVWDWSSNNRNSLSETSQRLLGQLDSPIELTAYVRKDKLLRQRVRDLVSRYQRAKPNLSLHFVNPDLHPEQTRKLGITHPVELEISYAGKTERLKQFDEESISNALQRISRKADQWIVALRGHGERALMGEASYDLGQFSKALEHKGFLTQPLEIANVERIPSNTQVLIIAAPTIPLLPVEADKITSYVESGGNLLWITDPGISGGLESLLEQLGLSPLPGVIVDANAGTLGLDDPSFALVPRYPDHPLTRNLKALSLFPGAIAWEIRNSEPWTTTPILQTLSRSWNETGSIRGEVTVDTDKGERRGPLTLGVTMTRRYVQPGNPNSAKEQRLVIIGDGDFLSNAYLGTAGNLELGISILRWLGREDQRLEIPVRNTPDTTLILSRSASLVIGLGFLLLLPALLISAGIAIWWRRRRL